MGFEVVVPGMWTATAPLTPGTCAIDRAGNGTFLVADLARVRIVDRAVILADAGILTIALRAERSKERHLSTPVRPAIRAKGATDSGRRRIGLARAVKSLGLTPAAVAGRFEVFVKDDMLLMPLTTGKPAADGAAQAQT